MSLMNGRLINVGGRLVSLRWPKVMGILNLTPDSFYAASRMQTEHEIARRANQIVAEGGSMIDVGAFSTRPGAAPVSEEEETERLRRGLAIVRREQPGADYAQEEYGEEGRAALVVIGPRALEGEAHERGGVGPYGHEAAVPQRELAHEAEHEVEAGREQDEVAALPDARGYNELEAPVPAQRGREGAEGGVYAAGGEAVRQICALNAFFHTFSPTFFPSMPAGFTSSTAMRMRKTTASVRLELM